MVNIKILFYNFIFLIFKILILIYFDEYYYYYYYYRSIPNTKVEVFPKISLEPIQLLANIYKK